MTHSDRSVEHTDWAIIALTVGAGVLGAFQFGKASIALPPIQEQLDVGLSTASLLISIFGFIGATCGFAIGSLACRAGVHRFAVLGLTLGAAGGLLGSLAPAFGPLLASRAVEAAGFLCVQVSAPTLVATYACQEDRWLAFGMWGAYMPFGQALIIAIGPLIIESSSWRGLWALNALLMAVAALIAYLLLVRRAPRQLVRVPRREPASSLRVRLPRPPGHSLLLGLTFMTYSFQWIAISGFLPSLYVDRGIGLGTAGVLTAVVLGVNVVGNLAGGFGARAGLARWKAICLASLIMGACGLGIFAAWLPFELSFGLAVLFSGIGGVIPSTVLMAVPEFLDSPADMAAATGTVVQTSQISAALGPVAIGIAVSLSGSWTPVGPMLGLVALAGAALSLRVRSVEHARRTGGAIARSDDRLR